MKSIAYCAASFANATKQVIGVAPLTCPPMTSDSFDISVLKGNRFIYFDLHGELGQTHWFGDAGTIALTADQVAKADLTGTVVFGANCYLADEDSPMMDALLAAGAQFVVAAPGKNFSPPSGTLYGAALLAQWIFKLLTVNTSLPYALEIGKRRLELDIAARRALKQDAIADADEDALEFRAYFKK